MKKLFILGCIAFAIYFFLGERNISATPESAPTKSAFIIVFDDSGTLSEPEQAQQQKLLLLAHIKNLYKRRNYAKSELHIISSSFGRSVWVGQVSDLRSERAQEVLEKIEANAKHCNKLAESFTAVRSTTRNLEQKGVNDINVVFFSSMIATPSPCKDVEKIALPQLPPPINYEQLLTSSDAISSLGFLYVNPHQLRAYQDVLEPVAQWAGAEGKSFTILDMEATRAQLRTGIPGVK